MKDSRLVKRIHSCNVLVTGKGQAGLSLTLDYQILLRNYNN